MLDFGCGKAQYIIQRKEQHRHRLNAHRQRTIWRPELFKRIEDTDRQIDDNGQHIDEIVHSAGPVFRTANLNNLKNPFAKGRYILKHSCLSFLAPG